MEMAVIHTTDELETFAQKVLSSIQPDGGSTVFALSGDLGAGKTAFVQGLGRALGVAERIVSPTFLVMRRYAISGHVHFDSLVHIDAYRVEDISELVVLGLPAILHESRTLICIEWADRVAPLLSEAHVVWFRFVAGPDDMRTISYGKE